MKKYKLKQIKSAQGLNKHRTWIDLLSDITITSNDDVIGDSFYIDNEHGEGTHMKWFSSPTEAIKSTLERN